MRKFLLLLATLMTVISSFARDFEYTYEGQTITYTVINEDAKTCKTKEGNIGNGTPSRYVSGELVLPSNPKDGSVEFTLIEIGEYSFSYSSNLNSVSIPNSIRTIGNSAFWQCEGLTKAEFASIEAVCTIQFGNFRSNPLFYAKHLFIDNKEITELVIPFGVTAIEKFAFRNCINIKSAQIPQSVTSIGAQAFSDCIGLTSITIPNSVLSIGESAFDSCTGIESVLFGDSLESIGSYAFYSCKRLTSVIIPRSVTSVGYDAFGECNSLVKAAYPDNISENPFRIYVSIKYPKKSIIDDKGVIYNATKDSIFYVPLSLIGNFSIPSSVKYIGNFTFYECSMISAIDIPNSVTYIGQYAFGRCTKLTSISLPKSIINLNDNTFWACENINKIYIPNSVKTIGKSTFAGCLSLAEIIIPDSVEYIGKEAFDLCTGLKYIKIPNSVKSIDINAFRGCESLSKVEFESILSICKTNFESFNSNPLYYANLLYINGKEVNELIIPNSVTSIGDYAFCRCSSLRTITIPSSVATIGRWAFYDCSNLEKVDFASIKSLCDIYFEDEYSNPLYYAHHLFINKNEITEVKIPATISKLRSTFAGARYLEAVYIPNTITSIDIGTFDDCISLTSIQIPNSVTKIGDYAFNHCTNISSIKIPYSVNEIGKAAFRICSNLSSIELPNSITKIDDYTFVNCKNLTSILIPNSVKEIGYAAFNGCSLLKSVMLSDSLNTIGEWAFFGCSNLSTINIPNSVISIGGAAFYKCTELSTVYIPNSIQEFQIDSTDKTKQTWKKCPNIKDIYYDTENPIEGYEDMFDTEVYYNAILHLPINAVEKAKQIDPWKNFTNIEAYDFGGMNDVMAHKQGDIDYTAPYEIYNFNGMKIGDNKESLAPGLYIIRQGNIAKKIAIQ